MFMRTLERDCANFSTIEDADATAGRTSWS